MFGSVSEFQLTIVRLGWQRRSSHNMVVRKPSERISVQFLPFTSSVSLSYGMEPPLEACFISLLGASLFSQDDDQDSLS